MPPGKHKWRAEPKLSKKVRGYEVLVTDATITAYKWVLSGSVRIKGFEVAERRTARNAPAATEVAVGGIGGEACFGGNMRRSCFLTSQNQASA